MRLTLAVLVVIFIVPPYALAQDDLTLVRASSAVRVFTSSVVAEGSWVGVRNSDVVIQREGIRRTFPVAAVDSVQEFLAPREPGKAGMLAGAVVGGGALLLFHAGLCDYNCGKGNIGAAAIGALLGGVIGRIIGAIVSSAEGEWVTKYRRQ